MEQKEAVVVEWTLDDIMGELKRISLVSEPAIEQDFMMFGGGDMVFKAVDGEKRIVTGPAMRPNVKIKRYNDLGELYYGTFSEDVVRQAAELFFKKGSNTNKTNLEHEWEIDGVYVFESWIVENPEIDKSKELGFSGVKKGDWFVSMKIDNDVIWNNYLKTGLIKGFSVEVRLEEKEIDTIKMIEAVLHSTKDWDWKWDAITTLIDIDAAPYVDETGEIKKEEVGGIEEFQTYDDYPEAAKRNAQIALDWAEKNGWGSCGTPVGKARANQLAKGEKISEETIARMAAFERHRGNSKKELGDGCGRLMWQAWGGDEGVEWAGRKLKQIRNEKFGCPPEGDGKTVSGKPDKRCKDGSDDETPTTPKKKGGDDGSEGPTGKNIKSAENKEREIRDKDKEFGYMYIDGVEIPDMMVKSTSTSVQYDTNKLRAISGEDRKKMTTTHNHPGDGGSFSGSDFAFVDLWGVGELRAVDNEYDYSIKRDPKAPPVDTWDKKSISKGKKIVKEYNDAIELAEYTWKQEAFSKKPKTFVSREAESAWYDNVQKDYDKAWKDITHKTSEAYAKKLGYTYTRTKKK